MSRKTFGIGWRDLAGAGWGSGRRFRRGQQHRLRPALQELEERRLLATFTVTSPAANSSSGTLPWAIAQANATSGSGANTIQFAAALAGKTIVLSPVDPLGSNDPYGPTAFTITGTGPLTIDGGAAPGLMISGGNVIRPFAVKSGVALTLENLTVENGTATGGNGGSLSVENGGGGGGAGSGVRSTMTAAVSRPWIAPSPITLSRVAREDRKRVPESVPAAAAGKDPNTVGNPAGATGGFGDGGGGGFAGQRHPQRQRQLQRRHLRRRPHPRGESAAAVGSAAAAGAAAAAHRQGLAAPPVLAAAPATLAAPESAAGVLASAVEFLTMPVHSP